MHCDKAGNTVHLYMSDVLGNSGTRVRDAEEHVKKALTEEAELGPCRRNKNPPAPTPGEEKVQRHSCQRREP